MDIFNFITLAGGLAFFLYGMHVMSAGLEKMAGGKLEKILKKMTSNPLKGMALGAGITIAIQSSSAMTVMLVGLVNSGVMKLSQTVSLIMGSNVGTTLTAWILSMSGIEGDSFFIKMLKPTSFAPIIALIGIGFIMMAKKVSKKDLGAIFVGFAILMSGMTLMSDAVSPLADMPEFTSLLTAFTNPILGVIIGAVFTGLIQSSAASVGILQALALTGSITYEMAIPIIMGQNIGTCVTALISSIGVNKNAKRVSVVHITFNMVGTFVVLLIYFIAQIFFPLEFLVDPIDQVGIAACHSIFNIFTTALIFPFQKYLVRFAETAIKDGGKAEKQEVTFIDERLLKTPSVALSECHNRTVEMAKLSKTTVLNAVQLLKNFDSKLYDQVIEEEDLLDRYEDKLGTYLVKLSSSALSMSDSKEISTLLHTIGDFERLGDHAVNLLKTAKEITDKEIVFSEDAGKEIDTLTDAIQNILTITVDSFVSGNLEHATDVEPLEQVIDELITTIKANHIRRLQHGNCTIELGFVLSDLLTNYARISDHCSNIAVAMIEVAQNSFDTHEYLNSIKTMDNEEFKKRFQKYREQYKM